MSSRRLVLALLAAAGLLSLAWWLEIERPARERLRAEAATRLLVESAELERLEVRRGDEQNVLRPREDGSWSLDSSRVDRTLDADGRAVRLLRGSLEAARLETLEADLTRAGPLETFSLEPVRLAVTWATPEGERTLVLGAPVPPAGRRVYGLIEGRLVTVPRRLVLHAAWGSDHWRSKSLLRFDRDELDRLVIERLRDRPPGAGPRLVLGEDHHPSGLPGEWRVLEPFEAPGHPARLPALLSQLQALMADGFGPEQPSAEVLAEAGLSPPRTRVLLEFHDGRRAVLQLGRPRDLTAAEKERAGDRPTVPPVFGRLDEGPLVEIRPDLAESLLLADERYRDNRALPVRHFHLRGFTFHKPRRSSPAIEFELSREAESAWRAVRPAPAEPSVASVSSMLTALQAVLFGRFEDAIAADPSGFETAYDLSLPDTFTIEARGLDGDGRPVALLIEAGPPGAIIQARTPYRPVRLTDQAGRRTVGIAKFRAFDSFLEKALALHESILEQAGEVPP